VAAGPQGRLRSEGSPRLGALVTKGEDHMEFGHITLHGRAGRRGLGGSLLRPALAVRLEALRLCST